MTTDFFDRPLTACPGCNAKLVGPAVAHGVLTCSGCNGLVGVCSVATMDELVGTAWSHDPEADARARYFDFTTPDGKTRRHGWFDPKTKRITQTG